MNSISAWGMGQSWREKEKGKGKGGKGKKYRVIVNKSVFYLNPFPLSPFQKTL